jgi:hypothetical protein
MMAGVSSFFSPTNIPAESSTIPAEPFKITLLSLLFRQFFNILGYYWGRKYAKTGNRDYNLLRLRSKM